MSDKIYPVALGNKRLHLPASDEKIDSFMLLLSEKKRDGDLESIPIFRTCPVGKDGIDKGWFLDFKIKHRTYIKKLLRKHQINTRPYIKDEWLEQETHTS